MIRRAFAKLLLCLPLLGGCAHFHPYDPDNPDPIRPADHVPDESKNCVYVFLIDSLDPFAGPGLINIREFAHHLGFGKTYYGHSCHVSYFAEKIQGLRSCCGKHARFVIIGFDTGAEGAQRLAAAVAEQGLPVDVTIYIEPGNIVPREESEIALNSYTVRSTDEPNATKGKTSREGVATDPETLELIERELTLVGLSVPPPRWPEGKKVLLVPAIPAPRSAQPNPKSLAPEWQFLKPRNPFDTPPVPRPPQPSETLPLPKVLPELPEPSPKK
jgi:hypothetical protein